MDYMINKLGIEGYEKLKIKALSITKFTLNDLKVLIVIYQQKLT